MIESEYKDRILKVIRNIKNIQDINEKNDLSEDLGFDSLNIVYLFVTLEQEFNIQIKESDLDPNKLKTVQDVFNLVSIYI